MSTQAEFEQAVRAQWHCVHTAWTPLLSQWGWSTLEPEVAFYPGEGTDSECGYLNAPAFYCSAGNGTAYFGGDHFQMARQWELSINEMVNHEYGHHIQSLAGITGAKLLVEPADDLERRSELQVVCWSAMMTAHNLAVGFDEADWIGWQERLNTMQVDAAHGGRASMLYWGTRGLYAQSLADCNTWVVAPAEVS
ncbi:MAG: hypothetical protein ACK5KO_08655 [Arachnia sp.]